MTTQRLAFALDHLDLQAASGVDDARWEPFQVALLNDDSTFTIENKSRQIAWSFSIALDAVLCAVLDANDSIFTSINLDEAKEKIRYSKSVYRNLNGVALPKIVRDNELGLELENGARLSSLPSRPPRGRARARVYLDEFAHVQHDKSIYTAALPVISKGGVLRMGSSPLGASGVFWEIFSQTLRQYPGYTRRSTPWWAINAFCLNVKEAIHLAPGMPPEHRVELFGNDRIKAIYANMPEEDFRQEYECEFVDESTAWITWDEIKRSQDADHVWTHAQVKGKEIGPALDAIARYRDLESVLVGGMDIGRTRNTTEIYLLGISSTQSYPLRLAITLDGVEFDDQYMVLSQVLKSLPVTRLLIDQNGIGRNLAENAHKEFGDKAIGVNFTNATKTLWATEAKMLIQKGKTPLPVDRDLGYQIHSIKKTVTANKNLVFDTERNEKHHADKFWAWALALSAGKQIGYMNDSQTAGSHSMETYA